MGDQSCFRLIAKKTEHFLLQHPAVMDAAVFPGESPGLAGVTLVLQPGISWSSELERDLTFWIKNTVGIDLPPPVVLNGKLPRTASGKISRYLTECARQPGINPILQ
ncbi:MAG: AMP-binding enzyme [Bacillota bacterium]